MVAIRRGDLKPKKITKHAKILHLKSSNWEIAFVLKDKNRRNFQCAQGENVPAWVHITTQDEDVIHCGFVGENVRDQEEAACRLLHLITIEENILDIHVEKCLCREAATTVSMRIEGRWATEVKVSLLSTPYLCVNHLPTGCSSYNSNNNLSESWSCRLVYTQ